MKTRLQTIWLFVLMGIVATRAQTCNECQDDNDAYCVSQTQYYNCMKGSSFGSIQNCTDGYVCSNNGEVCIAKSTVGTDSDHLDVCSGTSANGADCESCSSGSNLYTCVSSYQFARCSGGSALTSTVYDCDTNEVCVLSALTDFGTLCVPNCTATFLSLEPTCSNEVFQAVTTTAAPATTPDAAELQDICIAASSQTSYTFFYTRIYADTTCNSYAYCQEPSGNSVNWIALPLSCPSANPYYDTTTMACVAQWPASCAVTVSTTSTTSAVTTDSSAVSDSSTTDASSSTDSSVATESTTTDASSSTDSSVATESTTTDASSSTDSSVTSESSTDDASSSTDSSTA